MQIQSARALIELASAVMQMNPLAGSDGLHRGSDHDAVLHDVGICRDVEDGHLVAKADRLAAVNWVVDACADDLNIFFHSIGQ